ncbi:MAG: ribose 5-phosphate isomerase B [Elusimicrobia bacterium RIFOXYA2_FULL_39_19]|nr:MAG: ribose 5-phosphate isomerase B [Elusimicrobia bacterium RIFOXYA2_FULL_39_19]
MIVAFGCDHAAFSEKEKILEFLKSEGHKVIDCGCFSTESCDYPDYAEEVAKQVAQGNCDKGILACGSGIGMSITANKIQGIRAALCYNDETASLASKHNNANVLCVGTRFFSTNQINNWIKIWLSTPFEGGRHTKRVDKMNNLDEKNKMRCK